MTSAFKHVKALLQHDRNPSSMTAQVKVIVTNAYFTECTVIFYHIPFTIFMYEYERADLVCWNVMEFVRVFIV